VRAFRCVGPHPHPDDGHLRRQSLFVRSINKLRRMQQTHPVVVVVVGGGGGMDVQEYPEATDPKLAPFVWKDNNGGFFGPSQRQVIGFARNRKIHNGKRLVVRIIAYMNYCARCDASRVVLCCSGMLRTRRRGGHGCLAACLPARQRIWIGTRSSYSSGTTDVHASSAMHRRPVLLPQSNHNRFRVHDVEPRM